MDSTVLSGNLVMSPEPNSAGSGQPVTSSSVTGSRRCQDAAPREGRRPLASTSQSERHVARSWHKVDSVRGDHPARTAQLRGRIGKQRSKCPTHVTASLRWAARRVRLRRSACPRGHVARVTTVSLLALRGSLSEDAMLTTREAGRLVGRSDGAVRKALMRGRLAGERHRDQRDHRDYWLVRTADVLSWAENNPKGHGPILPLPRTEEVAELLREYGSASAEELSQLLQVHVGNARKYLAILGAQGRAKRDPDGQWVLITDAEGAA